MLAGHIDGILRRWWMMNMLGVVDEVERGKAGLEC